MVRSCDEWAFKQGRIMLDFLSELSDFNLFLLLSSVAILTSIAFIWLGQYFVPTHTRYKNNEVVGSIGALIGIVYGVLAGLTALYLINNINYTEDIVLRESNAAADVYRDAAWLEDPARSQIQAQVKNYLMEVVKIEWPLMRRGSPLGLTGDILLDEMMTQLQDATHQQKIDSATVQNIVMSIKALYDARHQRIHMSQSSLTPDIWAVLLLGTVLTIAVNYLFGMNFYLHLIMVSAAALMCTSMLFLIVTLDRPFQGEFIVEPDAFQSLLTLINKRTIT